MNLQRIKQLAGIRLNESVQAVPGIGEAVASVGPDYVEEKAPPGMEALVMKLKNEYGHDKEGKQKAFATAWSIYNKKHGKAEECAMMEDDVEEAYVDVCNQDNPEDARDACHMEEDHMYQMEGENHWIKRFIELTDNPYFIDPQEAAETVEREMEEAGVEGHEYDEVITFIQDRFGDMDHDDEPSDGMTDAEADADALASAGMGSDEDYGHFGGDEFEEGQGPRTPRGTDIDPTEINSLAMLPVEAAKARAHEILGQSTTTDIKKQYLMGRINKARSAMDVAALLYNMVLKGEGHGVQGSHYSKKFDSAVEENFDLNNGYDEEHDASATDYFPTGADSPVVTAIGGNAKSGDNPEQKRVAVAEVHKELVYSYRNYLKESETKKKT
jgi:hypothetical protein